MQKRRDTGDDRLLRLQPVSASQNMSLAWAFARDEAECRSPGGPLFPQPVDLLVRFLEFGDCRAPVAENRCHLSRTSLRASNLKDIANPLRDRISDNRTRVGRGRNPETSEVIV